MLLFYCEGLLRHPVFINNNSQQMIRYTYNDNDKAENVEIKMDLQVYRYWLLLMGPGGNVIFKEKYSVQNVCFIASKRLYNVPERP